MKRSKPTMGLVWLPKQSARVALRGQAVRQCSPIEPSLKLATLH